MYAVGLPCATVLGYVLGGGSGALACFVVGVLLLIFTAWLVRRSASLRP